MRPVAPFASRWMGVAALAAAPLAWAGDPSPVPTPHFHPAPSVAHPADPLHPLAPRAPLAHTALPRSSDLAVADGDWRAANQAVGQAAPAMSMAGAPGDTHAGHAPAAPRAGESGQPHHSPVSPSHRSNLSGKPGIPHLLHSPAGSQP